MFMLTCDPQNGARLLPLYSLYIHALHFLIFHKHLKNKDHKDKNRLNVANVHLLSSVALYIHILSYKIVQMFSVSFIIISYYLKEVIHERCINCV